MGFFEFLFGDNSTCRVCGCEVTKDDKPGICSYCLSEQNSSGGHGVGRDDDDDPMLFGSGD